MRRERPTEKRKRKWADAPEDDHRDRPRRKRSDDFDEVGEDEERDLEETLDRKRHGSGDYDPDERYGRTDVTPDREGPGPGEGDDG